MEILSKNRKMIFSLGAQIFTLAFLREIMLDEGIDLGSGIVLVANDLNAAKRFIRLFCRKTESAKWLQNKLKSADLPNFYVGFALIRQRSDVESLEIFMDKDNFLPVVVTGGLLSDFFRENCLILKIKQSDIDMLDTEDFSETIRELRYTIINCIQGDRREHKSKLKNDEIKRKEPFLSAFCYVQRIILKGLYDSDIFSETQMHILKEISDAWVDSRFHMFKKLQHEKSEVIESLSSTLEEFVRTHGELEMMERCEFRRYDEPGGVLMWFDEDFYYIPERTFKVMCGRMLDFVSWNAFKSILREEGVLVCDRSGDYTCKVAIGGEKKVRVLKLDKILLCQMSDNGDSLEDIYEDREVGVETHGTICR